MKNQLFTMKLKLTTAASALFLTACSIAPQVRTSYDSTADFTQYKTFGFMNPLATDRSGYQSLVSQELKANTRRELEARGMRMDNVAPQLLVNFNAALKDKTRIRSSPVLVNGGLGFYGGSYYGYRGGAYSPWPMYIDETVVTTYKEGTLNIDLIDALRKQLVWEGVVIDSNVTQDELANLPESLSAAVKAVFSKFPLPMSVK
jgi:Domain of unknown function (DUF4136)